MPSQSIDIWWLVFHHHFKFYKLSVPANGKLSLQMVADVRLCFYNYTQPASVTDVPLLFIEHRSGSQCGKLSSACYSHWQQGTCLKTRLHLGGNMVFIFTLFLMPPKASHCFLTFYAIAFAKWWISVETKYNNKKKSCINWNIKLNYIVQIEESHLLQCKTEKK